MTAARVAALGLALALAGAVPACSSPAPAPSRAATGLTEADLMARGEQAGIHNLAEPAPGLLRGAEPEGEASFALLASLGVRTILSVDGARPDAEAAARHGIRTVHIPIEYSGLTRPEQVKIAKVALQCEGGLFVHCHHGKHRGPAASGIAWMALDGVDAKHAVDDMHRAGTDPKYLGLYRDVERFRPVTADELAAVRDEDLPAAAKVADLVGAMVAIDETYDRMKAIRKAGWATPPSMPDVAPPHEARILAERFRELARLDAVQANAADFRGWLEDAEKASWELEESIRGGAGGAAAKALDRVAASCAACHARYRDNRP